MVAGLLESVGSSQIGRIRKLGVQSGEVEYHVRQFESQVVLGY